MYEGLTRKLGVKDGGFYKPVWIDGLPGYVSYERDNVFQTTAFEIEDGKIVTVYITRNPDKLQHIAKVLAITPPESQLRH
jgi:RNA polymerase sigma-70 factor (ECF subfamily)